MPLAPDRPWVKRVIVAAAIVVPLLYALAVNSGELDEPPAWDSAITVSPAALTIVDLDFDVLAVAGLPSSPEGGPSTHATSVYTIGLAVLIAVLGSAQAFFVAHLVSIALIGLLSGATYLLARERASVPLSALVAVVIGIMPVVVQQSADVYLDLPLAVVATFASWTASRRRFTATAALALVGVAIKTSGVFLLPLILFARPVGRSMRRHLASSAAAGAIASVPFLIAVANTHRFSTDANPLTDPTLIRSSASLLVLTTDVFFILAAFLLVLYGRTRARVLDRPTKVAVIAVASFFVVHLATILLSGTIAILPRYYIVILPAVVAALAPLEPMEGSGYPTRSRIGIGLLVALGIFAVVNLRGSFYPLPDHDFYVAAERSTRAQDLLELHVVGTRELAATGLPLLVERQVYFRLEYPGMGYVDATPRDVIPVFIGTIEGLPDRFAMLIERRYTNPLVVVEEVALEEGYDLTYRDLEVGPYRSQLVLASR